MTSVHNWNDVRIFVKECQSLAKAGYEVYLVSEGVDCEIAGVHVVGCGDRPLSRRARMRGFAHKIYERARALDCDIYHFHDPELMPFGLKLKKQGKKVIFDSHEDVSGQIMSKYWIPVLLRWIVAKMYRIYEAHCVKSFDAVVTATPYIAKLFVRRVKKVVVINNFPKLDDIVFQTKPFAEREAIVCYAGGINEIRGKNIMIEAIRGIPNAKLVLAGHCEGDSICETDMVEYLGEIDRNGVNNLYGRSVAGMVILKPVENYINSRPVKMYEYMAAGLPFVCSDFSLWREVANETGAGFCVPFNDINAIQNAINILLRDREKAQKMGECGRKAVEEKYSWLVEEKKLLELYEDLV